MMMDVKLEIYSEFQLKFAVHINVNLHLLLLNLTYFVNFIYRPTCNFFCYYKWFKVTNIYYQKRGCF